MSPNEIQVFSLDEYIQAFVGGNWISIGIFLIMLRSIANQFGVEWIRRIYMILNNAMAFIRPSSDLEKAPTRPFLGEKKEKPKNGRESTNGVPDVT